MAPGILLYFRKRGKWQELDLELTPKSLWFSICINFFIQLFTDLFLLILPGGYFFPLSFIENGIGLGCEGEKETL